MAIRAVIFDVGGVLEITPKLGVEAKWEPEFGVGFDDRLPHIWRAGSVGKITLAEVHEQIAATLGVAEERVSAARTRLASATSGTGGRSTSRPTRAVLTAIAAEYREGGWPCEADGDVIKAPYSAPSAGTGPWHLYRVTVNTVVATAMTEPHGVTKWWFR